MSPGRPLTLLVRALKLQMPNIPFALLLLLIATTSYGMEASPFDGSWRCQAHGSGAMTTDRYSLNLEVRNGQVTSLLAENVWIRGKDGDGTLSCVFDMDEAPKTRQSTTQQTLILEARNFDNDETFCEVRISRAKHVLRIEFGKNCESLCPESFKVLRNWSLDTRSSKCLP